MNILDRCDQLMNQLEVDEGEVGEVAEQQAVALCHLQEEAAQLRIRVVGEGGTKEVRRSSTNLLDGHSAANSLLTHSLTSLVADGQFECDIRRCVYRNSKTTPHPPNRPV